MLMPVRRHRTDESRVGGSVSEEEALAIQNEWTAAKQRWMDAVKRAQANAREAAVRDRADLLNARSSSASESAKHATSLDALAAARLATRSLAASHAAMANQIELAMATSEALGTLSAIEGRATNSVAGHSHVGTTHTHPTLFCR